MRSSYLHESNASRIVRIRLQTVEICPENKIVYLTGLFSLAGLDHVWSGFECCKRVGWHCSGFCTWVNGLGRVRVRTRSGCEVVMIAGRNPNWTQTKFQSELQPENWAVVMSTWWRSWTTVAVRRRTWAHSQARLVWTRAQARAARTCGLAVRLMMMLKVLSPSGRGATRWLSLWRSVRGRVRAERGDEGESRLLSRRWWEGTLTRERGEKGRRTVLG